MGILYLDHLFACLQQSIHLYVILSFLQKVLDGARLTKLTEIYL